MTKRIVFPREVLLVEVERWCREPLCGARTRVSMTKAQARAYTGFECERCARWYADALSERDIPEWWEELNVASLAGLKPAREIMKPKREGAPVPKKDSKPVRELSLHVKEEVEEEVEEDEAEAVVRLSREWRRLGGERETDPDEAEEKRGDSF